MKTNLAWAAGFIDGEGCIYIARRLMKGQTQYVLTLSVSNTHLPSLERLKEIFKVGSIHSARPLRQSHHKPIFVWTSSAKSAEKALRLITPYLVTKKEQARVGLLSRKFVYPRGGYRKEQGKPNYDQLSVLKQRLTELKAVGSNR